MKISLVLLFTLFSCLIVFSQEDNQNNENAYAYIVVQGKAFSKKLIVEVDLGDSLEEIKKGKEFSNILMNKKPYAAILNYMSQNKYELVESRDLNFTFQGSGGSSGIVLIMKKRKSE